MNRLPHVSPEPYVTAILKRAERLGWPAVDVAGETVGPGEKAWGAFVAEADRGRLVRAVGVLVVMEHRTKG